MQVEDRTGRYPVITERRGSITTHVKASVLPRKLGFFAALATVPLGVGALLGRRSRTAGIVAGGLTAAALVALRWQLQRFFTDEPTYEVEQRIGELEIRKIRARVEARVHVDGTDFDAAREHAFQALADYIFGANARRDELSLSAPANAEPEKLAMTAPVVMGRANGGYEMSFVMPKGRTLMSLPRPADPAVTLREAPERHVAVLKFRANYSAAEIERREKHLRTLVAAAGLTAFGPVVFAGFDPPWTLPFLKRTELWLEIE